MQDPNSLIFDNDPKDTSKILDEIKESLYYEPERINPFDDIEEFNKNIPKINTSPESNKVKEDIQSFKVHQANKQKADIFNMIWANEMQAFFDEHKHIPDSKTKKRIKASLIKRIDKGDIYINKVGKLIIRKGDNRGNKY